MPTPYEQSQELVPSRADVTAADLQDIGWWKRPTIWIVLTPLIAQFPAVWWLVSDRWPSERLFVLSAVLFGSAVYYMLFQVFADRDLRTLLHKEIDRHHATLDAEIQRHHRELRLAVTRQ